GGSEGAERGGLGPRRPTKKAGHQPRPDPAPLDVASRLLARASLTEAALRDRLERRGYQPETAARAVTRCRELGYVSDERLAFDRARALRLRGAGSLKIADDLRARGLAEGLVAAAVEASPDGAPQGSGARPPPPPP